MLRIGRLAEDQSSVTLKVEGRIISEWVPILEEASLAVVQEGRSLLLDFSEVTFIDGTAASMLKRLNHEKIRIINCPPLIKNLLRAKH